MQISAIFRTATYIKNLSPIASVASAHLIYDKLAEHKIILLQCLIVPIITKLK